MTFDLRTEIRNPQSGKVEKIQPYRMHVSREHGEVFERDGKFYSGDGVELAIKEWPPKKQEVAVTANLPRK